jgi:hypothetical protein
MKYFIFREGSPRRVLTGWGFEDEDKTSSGRWLVFNSKETAIQYLDEAGLPTDVIVEPFNPNP